MSENLNKYMYHFKLSIEFIVVFRYLYLTQVSLPATVLICLNAKHI